MQARKDGLLGFFRLDNQSLPVLSPPDDIEAFATSAQAFPFDEPMSTSALAQVLYGIVEH